MIDIEFVTASHNDATLHGQLKRSPIFQKYALTEKKGFNNIPEAYNSLGPISDLTCYVHHDVFLPSSFESDLIKSLDRLPGDWGVIGVAGVRLIKGKKQNQGYILDRGNDWGSMWNLPAEVDTLDEMLLITRGDFVFDEQFPLDFYGADICIQAKAQGKKCYVCAVLAIPLTFITGIPLILIDLFIMLISYLITGRGRFVGLFCWPLMLLNKLFPPNV
jgi:hypothetical protein